MELQRELTEREATNPIIVEALARYEQRRAALHLGQSALPTEVQVVPLPVEQATQPE